MKAYALVDLRLADKTGTIARLTRDLNTRDFTVTIRELEQLTNTHAPALLTNPSCAALTTTKIIDETASVNRFANTDTSAHYNDTTPLPVRSSNVPRHKLSHTGNRQLNAATHRIALTQARHHQPTKNLIKRRIKSSKSGRDALRNLKRHLSRTVYKAHQTDQQASPVLTA